MYMHVSGSLIHIFAVWGVDVVPWRGCVVAEKATFALNGAPPGVQIECVRRAAGAVGAYR